MKRLNRILTAPALVALALALPLQTWAQQADAPDISGEWELTRQGGPGGGGGGRRGGGGGGGGGGPRVGGAAGASKMLIKQDGNTFTGTIELPFGTSDIQEGTINGNDVSFKIVIERRGRTIEMLYTGKIEDGAMSGTLSGGFGGRGGGGGGGGGGGATWKATRVET